MKTIITEAMFKDAFTQAHRGDNFSYAGLSTLYRYLVEMEEDCGIEIELDVIALCCEFSEYESAADCITTCGYEVDLCDMDADDAEEAAIAYLRENTFVIEFEGGIIIRDF